MIVAGIEIPDEVFRVVKSAWSVGDLLLKVKDDMRAASVQSGVVGRFKGWQRSEFEGELLCNLDTHQIRAGFYDIASAYLNLSLPEHRGYAAKLYSISANMAFEASAFLNSLGEGRADIQKAIRTKRLEALFSSGIFGRAAPSEVAATLTELSDYSWCLGIPSFVFRGGNMTSSDTPSNNWVLDDDE